MDLSIIIPAYNESQRLPPTLNRIISYFRDREESIEIIVVDDGSTDNTVEIVRTFGSAVRLIKHEQNQGKGAAVRTGMLAAQGTWRLLTDSDLSTPIEDIEKLQSFQNQAEVIIGSRRIAGADIQKQQAQWKVWLGQLGNLMIQLLLVRGIQDTQCGFKLFHQRARNLFEYQRLNQWGYDFELLYLARLAKWKIKEVPVRWNNDEQSKVKTKDYFTTLLDIFRVHLNRWRGYYKNI